MKKEVVLVLVIALTLLNSVLVSSEESWDNHYLVSDTKSLRVAEYENPGKVVWDYKCKGDLCFCKEGTCFYGFDYSTRLKNGNTLLTDNVRNRVAEVDIEGNLVWWYGNGNTGSGYNQVDHPGTSIRLSNGNTLIADSGNNRVIEVDKLKIVSWEYGCENKYLDCSQNTIYENLKSPASATPTNKGTVLIADTDNNRVIEVTKKNEIVWGFGCTVEDITAKCEPSENNLFKPMYAVKLEDGFLITDTGNNRIIEVDKEKNIIWKYGSKKGVGFNELNYPKSAIELDNENILITDTGNNRFIEVNKSTKKIVLKYSGLNSPSYVEVPSVSYERIRASPPGCYQNKSSYYFEFKTTENPKYTYVQKEGDDKKKYLKGVYSNGLFKGTDKEITESGKYLFSAAYEDRVLNYTVFCKLDALMCSAIKLSITSCEFSQGKLNISFSGIGEQSRFIDFNNIFLDIRSDEKTWSEISERSCGDKPRTGLERFGFGSYVRKVDEENYQFIAPIGNYNVRFVTLMLGECCFSNEEGIMKYPETKYSSSCIIEKKCSENSECNDGNPYTDDFCIDKKCTNQKKNVSCLADSDCNDYNKCTVDFCVYGKCTHSDKCTGCSYCDASIGCITNETCLYSIEKNQNEKQNLLKNKQEVKNESFIKEDKSNWFKTLLIIFISVFLIGIISFSFFLIYKIKKNKADKKEKKEVGESKKKDVVEQDKTEQKVQGERGIDNNKSEISSPVKGLEKEKVKESVNLPPIKENEVQNNNQAETEKDKTKNETSPISENIVEKSATPVTTTPINQENIIKKNTVQENAVQNVVQEKKIQKEGNEPKENNKDVPDLTQTIKNENKENALLTIENQERKKQTIKPSENKENEVQKIEGPSASPISTVQKIEEKAETIVSEKNLFEKNVNKEEEFLISSGKKIKNLYELLFILKNLKEDFFSIHVTAEKNDFADWVIHSIKSQETADKIREAKTKDGLISILEKMQTETKT